MMTPLAGMILGPLPKGTPSAAAPALPPGWTAPGRGPHRAPPIQKREVLPEVTTVTPEANYDARGQKIAYEPETAQQAFNGSFANTDQRFSPEETSALASILERNQPSYLEELPRAGTRRVRTEEGKTTDDWVDNGPTPTRAQSAAERGYDQMQIGNTEAADARRNESLALEAVEQARQAKIAEMESIMEFQRKHGVSPDSPVAPVLLKAEEERMIDMDQKRAEDQVKKLRMTNAIDDEAFDENMRAIRIFFGMKRHAPGDWAKAVAPPPDLFSGLGGSSPAGSGYVPGS